MAPLEAGTQAWLGRVALRGAGIWEVGKSRFRAGRGHRGASSCMGARDPAQWQEARHAQQQQAAQVTA